MRTGGSVERGRVIRGGREGLDIAGRSVRGRSGGREGSDRGGMCESFRGSGGRRKGIVRGCGTEGRDRRASIIESPCRSKFSHIARVGRYGNPNPRCGTSLFLWS